MGMGATSRSVDIQQTSCSCRHLDDAALRNPARVMSSARVAVWRVDSGLKAECDMTSDWNTSWSDAQDGTECVGCGDSIYADETRKWRECTLTTGDDNSAKQPRVDDPTPLDLGGAQLPSPVATPSISFDMAAARPPGQGGCELHLRPAQRAAYAITALTKARSGVSEKYSCLSLPRPRNSSATHLARI